MKKTNKKTVSAATEHGKEMCVCNTNPTQEYCTHTSGKCQIQFERRVKIDRRICKNQPFHYGMALV